MNKCADKWRKNKTEKQDMSEEDDYYQCECCTDMCDFCNRCLDHECEDPSLHRFLHDLDYRISQLELQVNAYNEESGQAHD